MNDNPSFSGIESHHWPALIAVLLAVPVAWVARRVLRRRAGAGAAWAVAMRDEWADRPLVVHWAVGGLVVTALVHLALPLGHNDDPLLTAGFLASGVAYLVLAAQAVAGRRWRAATALLVVATIVAYLVVVGKGNEEADQVGLATALDELLVLGLCLIAPRHTGERRLRRFLVRPLASTGLVLAVLVSGVVSWGQFAAQHDDHHVTADSATGLSHDGHDHHHDFLARAQAGVILRPAGGPPTAEQQRAAAAMAERTTAAVARYTDYRAAVAAGYRLDGPQEGLQLHFSNKAYQNDGRIMDPEAPETLVYAGEHGRIVLLGVMYQVPTPDERGPAVGGSLTHWHTHNVCFTLLPPGFGIVSPYGTCPFASFDVTPGEMIHLWTVNPPGGPWIGHPGDAWVRDLLARQGLPR